MVPSHRCHGCRNGPFGEWSTVSIYKPCLLPSACFILCLPSLSSVLASAQLRAAVGGGLSLQVDLRPSVSGLKSMFSISKDFSKHSFVSYIVVYTVLNNTTTTTTRERNKTCSNTLNQSLLVQQMISKGAQRYFPLIPHKHMHTFIMLFSFHQFVYSFFIQSFVGHGNVLMSLAGALLGVKSV